MGSTARTHGVNTALMISAAAAAAAAAVVWTSYLRSAPRRLRISSIAELHDAISSAKVLRRLVSNEYLISIEKADDSDTDVEDLPVSELLQLSSVLELRFLGHHIARLQPQACQLRGLRCLDLSGNKLANLPPDIKALSSLEDLNLGRNCIVSLPAEVGNLQKLRFLNLMANHLVSIPEELCQLSALYRLGLKGNQLTHLPERLGGLSGLVELFITGEHVVRSLVNREWWGPLCGAVLLPPCDPVHLVTQLSDASRCVRLGNP